MEGRAFHTGTVTMLFTDIEGSTRLLKQLGPRYGDLLAEHRRLLREAVEAQGGREMDNQGDAFFFAFARALNAVEAAVGAQRALASHEWPDGVECRVRMGLHTGEPLVGDEGYHGIGLHRGARIAAAAHGGQVLLSNATAELVHDDLPAGIALKDLGPQQLKDIDRPERVYQLVVDGLPSEFPPPRTGAPAKAERPRRRVALAAAGVVAAAAAVVAVVLTTRGSGGAETATAASVSADTVGIFRPSNGRLTGQIEVGASPSAVTAGAGSVWVANVDAKSVSRIDPVKQVTIQTIPVGNGPSGIAYGGGFVWVTNGLDGTVSKIDPQTDSVVHVIEVGNGPAGVAVAGRYVWVANSSDGTLSRIDRSTDLARVFAAVPGASGVAVGDGSVWVTSPTSGSVARVDPRSGAVVGTVPAGNGADAVAVGEGATWVANELDGTVTRIDPASNAVRAAIPVGDGPNGVTTAPGAVWVSNELAGTLSRIDPLRNLVVQTVKTGNRPEGVVVSAGQLFVAVRASGAGHRGGRLIVVDGGTNYFGFDPATTYSFSDWGVMIGVYDGLTGFRRVGGSEGTRLVPDLATSLPVPTDGGLSYSFHLRPGIRYSTGAPLRPEDLRHSIERAVQLQYLGGGPGFYFNEIVGASGCTKKACDLSKGIVVDAAAGTITFHLVAPDHDFLYKLALPAAYAVPSSTPLHVRAAPPGTGPYRIASFDLKRGVRLVRNPKFREWSPAAQPSGFPDEIEVRFGGTADSHVATVDRGAADLVTDMSHVSLKTGARARTQHASRIELDPVAATFYVYLNTHLAPFDDVRARQAFNLAVDRRRLAALTDPQHVSAVTCQVLPPNFDGFRRYCPYTAGPGAHGTWTAPDLARARRLVRASGTEGQAVKVWIPTWIHYDRAVGDYIASVLNSIGYRGSYRFAPSVNASGKLGIQAGFTGWFADFATPSGFIVPALTCRAATPAGGSSNLAAFCDPAIDREIARAQSLQTSDPERASRLWAKVDHDIVDQAPWVAFANGVAFLYRSDRVGNYQFNPQWGVLLDQLWVR